MKSEHAQDAAIADESFAPAYIQRFGTETFERGDKAIRSNTVTAQTVDTFQAAVTFLDLLHIWQPLPIEVAEKIKYAKYHAVRIGKDIKAGKDPNLSNPVQEPEPSAEEVPLDPNDPEVQRINSAAAYQPTVEDAHDEDVALRSPYSNPTPLPQRTTSAPRPVSAGTVSPPPPTQPPIHPTASPPHQRGSVSSMNSNPRKDSLGGGYFPETAPSAPAASAFQPPPASAPPPSAFAADISGAPHAPSDAAARSFYQSQTPSAPPPQPHTAPHAYPPPKAPPAQPPPPVASTNGQLVDDDVAMATAQKHARWAISALNFEDVPTAVKELRQALRTLGAG
ncbi:MAG: hypothetical protein Q9159_000084 [Coniocarpon cinnabarinum]